jgi:hypothetical protein
VTDDRWRKAALDASNLLAEVVNGEGRDASDAHVDEDARRERAHTMRSPILVGELLSGDLAHAILTHRLERRVLGQRSSPRVGGRAVLGARACDQYPRARRVAPPTHRLQQVERAVDVDVQRQLRQRV